MAVNMLAEATELQRVVHTLEPGTLMEILFVNGHPYDGDIEFSRHRGIGWEGGRTKVALLYNPIDPESEVYLVDVGYLRLRRCVCEGVGKEYPGRQQWRAIDLPGDPEVDESFPNLVSEQLRGVSGIEAAFMDRQRVYAVAREHRDVDWGAFVRAEDVIQDKFPGVYLSLRAHQGRDLLQMFPQMRRIF